MPGRILTAYLFGAAYWMGRAASESPPAPPESPVEPIVNVGLLPEVAAYLDDLAQALGITPEQVVIMGASYLTRAEQARRRASSVELMDVPATLADRTGQLWTLRSP